MGTAPSHAGACSAPQGASRSRLRGRAIVTNLARSPNVGEATREICHAMTTGLPTHSRFAAAWRLRRRLLLATAMVLVVVACTPPPNGPNPTPAETPRATDSAVAQPSSSGPTHSGSPEVITVDGGDRVQIGDLVSADALWVMVGSVDDHPVVWSSLDGLAWRREDIGPAGQVPGHLTAAAYLGERMLAVGWTSGQVAGGNFDRPLVVGAGIGESWTSSDDLPLPAQVGGLLTDVVWTSNEIVAVGSLSDGTPSSWRSGDAGSSWEGPAPVSVAGSSVAAIDHVAGEYVAVGESIGTVNGMGIWRSGDGTSWSAEGELPGSLADIVVTPLGPVAVGRDGQGAAAVVSLANSAHQLLQPPDVPDLGQAAVLDDRLVVSTSSPNGSPVWMLSGDSWVRVPIGREAGSVRAIAASNSGIGIAGDDGTRILFRLSSLELD